MKEDCAKLESKKLVLAEQLTKSKKAKKIQAERLLMQDEDLLSQQFEIDQVKLILELQVKHEVQLLHLFW